MMGNKVKTSPADICDFQFSALVASRDSFVSFATDCDSTVKLDTTCH